MHSTNIHRLFSSLFPPFLWVAVFAASCCVEICQRNATFLFSFFSLVNYSTQLQSLLDRQSTLQEEASSCRRERDRITSQVKGAEKQLNAIQKAEDGLLEQLQQLQDELHGLRQQKEEYAGEYEQLQEEQKRASDQVSLVERTLKSLEEEIDKVSCLTAWWYDLQVNVNHKLKRFHLFTSWSRHYCLYSLTWLLCDAFLLLPFGIILKSMIFIVYVSGEVPCGRTGWSALQKDTAQMRPWLNGGVWKPKGFQAEQSMRCTHLDLTVWTAI